MLQMYPRMVVESECLEDINMCRVNTDYLALTSPDLDSPDLSALLKFFLVQYIYCLFRSFGEVALLSSDCLSHVDFQNARSCPNICRVERR